MTENILSKLAVEWFETHLDQFKKETDRAAVILTVAIFEQILQNLIKLVLIPNASRDDSLFDGVNAPLSTFSAKIDICHRMGEISSRFARDLHLIRKIRNKFAHNVFGCTFKDGAVKNLVNELVKSSSHIFEDGKKFAFYGEGARGDFGVVTSWMLFYLNTKIETAKTLSEPDLEWGYKPSK